MGDVTKEGWGVTATLDGKLLKSCTKCYKELVGYANKIYELTVTNMYRFDTL